MESAWADLSASSSAAEARFGNPGRDACTRTEVELALNVLDVDFGGALADHQYVGDGAIAEPAADQRRHLGTSTTERYIFTDSAPVLAVFNRRTASADAAHLIPHLRPVMRVADLGCGSGSITAGLAAAVAPGAVVGFDVSEPAIAEARAHAQAAGLSNVQFEVANIYTLDLPDNSFDVVHFSGVLAHLAEPGRALELADRVLKPGGLVATREPQREGDWFGGPHREAMRAFNILLIDDWKTAGGVPFLGRRFASYCKRPVLSVWAASPEAVVAAAECTALGWKPRG